MSTRDLASWLPSLIGPVELQVQGSPRQPRMRINFQGGVTSVDVPEDDRIDLNFSNGIPSEGTGIPISDAGTVAFVPFGTIGQKLVMGALAPEFVDDSGGGGGGLTLPSGDPTIIGSNGTALVSITDAVALTGSDLAVPFQRADGTFGQGVCTNFSLPYNDGSGLASANLANSIGISAFGELVVIGTVGTNDGDLQAAHTSYNFSNGSSALAVNRGRVGYAKCVSLTQAGGAVTEYFDWPDASRAVLDVRGVFSRASATLRRSRTYEVSKVADNITVTAKAGGPVDEFTAIAGCDIVLVAGTGANAGKLGLTTTPASAAGTVTNISKSVDGDLLMRPST